MQDDRLEEFIKENRAELDTKEPSHSVWERIDISLSDGKVKTLQPSMWIWKAAVVVLLAAVTFLMVDRYTFKTGEVAEITTLEEFQELETFYASLISEKKLKIDDQISTDEFFTFLKADIEEIDAIYAELKRTFDEEQETPVVLNALVHLLRQKLHLVNSQLDVIHETKARDSGVELGDFSSL